MHLISELVGEHHYRWSVRRVDIHTDRVDQDEHPLDPIYHWEFSGGPRTFRAYFGPN
jgi:hypothetical protein